ncbi:hypothetical protein I6N91_02070 [Arthrobacter sp. MSA 4-2]|uniref:hypothetical protein n=1 Tax=Arthrobacter sp. MSA 4-2 TaxID=2794349 RepID=UPI0018E71D5D|nr:hypothetical protein [Arthrobacter sp. MSA 4-2]MBJ2119764.1 hypothetical protein [Arthrobacter sp. MSA 4-2]
MTISPIGPRAEDYLKATREVFDFEPNLTGLRLITAEVAYGFLIAQFENLDGTPRLRYGARVRLPGSTVDRLWITYTETKNVVHWVQWSVWLRAMEAYQTGDYQDQGLGSGAVRWLIDDFENG